MKVPLEVMHTRSKFESITAALDALIQENKAVFERYEELVIARNDALAAYKAAVSDRSDLFGSSYGSWKISAKPRTLDADALIEALGEEKAEELLKVSYSVDAALYDKAVANGDVPKKVQKKVEGEGTPRLTGPKPIGVYIK